MCHGGTSRIQILVSKHHEFKSRSDNIAGIHNLVGSLQFDHDLTTMCACFRKCGGLQGSSWNIQTKQMVCDTPATGSVFSPKVRQQAVQMYVFWLLLTHLRSQAFDVTPKI
ncbi:hypothetical protein EJB05_02467 [Eragrostis curvula]|uniref:Uncharacterized protein n=1 Tax=Eragrostis curvula TaxID=38414 RepID=A0A5J9WQM7_9POAL|nr:hypothetical protein EJB05_02467 [Eragrostis curvula]